MTAALQVVAKEYYCKSLDERNIYVKGKHAVADKKPARIVVCFPPCVYSHHFFDCPLSDYSLMDYLARKGFEVFAYDPRGFGSSYHPPDGRSVTYESEQKDAEALIQFVLAQTGARTVSMVAYGSGTTVACGYALRHPEQVDALALMDFVWMVSQANQFPPGFKEMLLNQPNGYLKLSRLSDMFDALMRPFVDPEILTWVNATFDEAPVGPFLKVFNPLPFFKPADRIKASVLIIRGSEAGITSEADSLDFLSKTGSRIRALDVLEGAGPVPSLEKEQYRTVLKDIAWFLAR
jgi:pimeloyl-ACP methyl ester carboxylesterase